MIRRINGKEIPPVMIGTWAWGPGMVGSGMVFGKKYDEASLIDTFKSAYQLGFNLWDTAEVYGNGASERLLAKCIRGLPDILISTKHIPSPRYKEGSLEKAARGSLERLGIQTIDLYWLHQPIRIQENFTEAVALLNKGIIKSVGLSNGNLSQIKEADGILKKNGYRLTAVQNHFSLLSMPEEQRKIVKWCEQEGVLYCGYMILEQGALSGHYDAEHPFPAISMRGFAFSKGKFRKIQPLLDYMKNLANQYGVDSSQIPVAWSVAKNIVPIVGLTKVRHAETMDKGLQIKLTMEEVDTLEKLAEETGVVCQASWDRSSR
jgi:aryl-alcohol dehydrogenase-like predicted oxidoreductase